MSNLDQIRYNRLRGRLDYLTSQDRILPSAVKRVRGYLSGFEYASLAGRPKAKQRAYFGALALLERYSLPRKGA